MSKTILVATDGSAQARKAIELGCVLAGEDGGRLGFIHVLLRDKTPEELQRLPEAGELGEDLAGELAKAASAKPDASLPAWASVMDPASIPSPVPRKVLEAIGQGILDAAAGIARHKGFEEFALEMKDGDAVQSILDVAKRLEADTIVMGHRGLRDIDALTLGSVSNKLSRLAPCDVVMIK